MVQQIYGLSGDLRSMQRHLNDLQPSIRDPLMQSLQQMGHEEGSPQPPGRQQRQRNSASPSPLREENRGREAPPTGGSQGPPPPP